MSERDKRRFLIFLPIIFCSFSNIQSSFFVVYIENGKKDLDREKTSTALAISSTQG